MIFEEAKDLLQKNNDSRDTNGGIGMNNIILIGFMGTGKTGTAKALAENLDKTYVSTDDLIEIHEGKAIRDIFQDDGEEYFREIEKEIVKKVMAKDDQVVDAGGGVVLDEGNVAIMKAFGKLVCLWAAPAVIHERTKRHKHRPLLNVDDPEAKIEELLEERRKFYMKADHHIDTTEFSIDEVVGKIIKMVCVPREE